jgi:hypothetical protein
MNDPYTFEHAVLEASMVWLARIATALPAAARHVATANRSENVPFETDEYDDFVHQTAIVALATAIESADCMGTKPEIVALYSTEARTAHAERIAAAIANETDCQ